MPMKTVIIGLGNPILTDDSVGVKVSRAIKEHLLMRSLVKPHTLSFPQAERVGLHSLVEWNPSENKERFRIPKHRAQASRNDRIAGLVNHQDEFAMENDTIDVKEVYAGGIRLMDAMTGYDRACIIDAMVTGRWKPGKVSEFGLDELCGTRNIVCTHDTNLSTAIELGRMLDMHLPSRIRIWGIEA
ncbi:MAG: hydrogenase maturation protease, partial [Nitrospirota bacterium]|nr:hydrogenase maturation protease [Nitrospirota bacterium]